MDIDLYHGILEEKRRKHKGNALFKYEVYNSVVVDNPEDVVLWRPEDNFENFKHLMDGRVLLYCELANSTPFEGHEVKKGFKDFIRKSARTQCVFGMDEIAKMKESVVGTPITYTEFLFDDSLEKFRIGNVVESDILEDEKDGEPYSTLCVFCFVDDDWVERKAIDGLAYLAFSIRVSSETCCVCGKTFTGEEHSCEHISQYSPNSSICRFHNFSQIVLED